MGLSEDFLIFIVLLRPLLWVGLLASAVDLYYSYQSTQAPLKSDFLRVRFLIIFYLFIYFFLYLFCAFVALVLSDFYSQYMQGKWPDDDNGSAKE